ncbi:MAG: PAS domain S-box protein [Smithellaceae bacterium]
MNDKDKSRMQLLDDVKVLRMKAADSEKLIDAYQQTIAGLKDNEKVFRLVAENSQNWEFWLNVDDRLIYSSPSSKRMTGYERDEFLKDASLLFKLIHPDDRPLFDEHRRLAKKTKSPGEEEFRVIRKDGKTRWFKHVCVPIYDDNGDYAGFRASNMDVTEQKTLQETMQEDEIRYQLLTENIGDMIWAMDAHHNLTYVSRSVHQTLGYEADEIFSKPVEDLLTPASLELVANIWDEEADFQSSGLARPQRSWDVQLEFLCQDGQTVWTESKISVIRDTGGKLVEIMASSRDITDRKKTEKTLRENELKLRQNENQLQEITRKLQERETLISDHEQKLAQNHQHLQTVTGQLAENEKQLQESTRQLQAHEKQLQEKEQKLEQNEKQLQDLTNRLAENEKQLQESARQLQAREKQLRENEQRIEQDEIQLQDLTGRLADREDQLLENTRLFQQHDHQLQESAELIKEREARLAESAQKLQESARRLRAGESQMRGLLNAATESIFLLDPDGTILFANETTAQRLGTDLATLQNKKSIYSLLPPDVGEKRRQRFDEVRKTGKPVRFEDERFGRTILNSVYPITGEDGAVAQLAVFGLDITEHKKSGEAQSHAARLESLGMLAGGIAHDFNNLMTIVQGYIDLAMLGIPEDSPARQNLQSAAGSIEKTRALTGQLITFSRGGEPVIALVPVEKTLHEACAGQLKSSSVQAAVEFQKGLWPALADKSQLRQCFCNLAENAAEAMPAGGTLKVRVENYEVGEEDALPLDDGAYVRIIFEDEGPGIPPDHLDKIFDPYFTTKDMGREKGMGLGLTVCYSILKKHGGYIAAGTAENGGARFTLYLPAKPEPVEEQEEPAEKVFVAARRRILVMDDHPEIRKLLQMYVEQLHYDAKTVAEGQEAIREYKQAQDAGLPFSAVILALSVRQGLGGAAALARLRKTAPDLRAIALSGSDDPLVKDYTDAGFQGILRKPFRFEEMKAVLESVWS